MRSTTFTTRILRLGICRRSRSTAASVSSVGTSPAHAITTSGSDPRSLLAHAQMPIPAAQCLIASSMESHCGCGCFPATITLMRFQLRRQMVGDIQQAICIRRQIDSHDVRLLVADVVDEAGVLMAEAVVVLTPDMRGEQVIERRNGTPPGNLAAYFEPLRMLVEHRIDDMDESLVAVEKTVPPRQQVAF